WSEVVAVGFGKRTCSAGVAADDVEVAVRIENAPDQIVVLNHRLEVVTNGAVQRSVVLVSETEVQSEVWFQSPLIRKVSRIDLVVERLNVGGRRITCLRIDQVECLIGGADDAAEQITQRVRARQVGGVDAADLSGRQA